MDWLKKYNIILGSGSPRRVQLMQESGYSFVQRVIEIDESFDQNMPSTEIAEYLAIEKSKVHTLDQSELLITADSIVVYSNQILGKPENRKEAIAFISMLSGNTHLVHTGVCIRSADKISSFTSTSEVVMNPLSSEEIIYYVDTYNPLDRAGAYGVQDWLGHNFVEAVKGSYTNIMGLPTAELYRELKEFVGV